MSTSEPPKPVPPAPKPGPEPKQVKPAQPKPGPKTEPKKGPATAVAAAAAQKPPVQAAPAQPPVARPSQFKRRHGLLALSFVLFVVVPLSLCTAYLYMRAADQYASHLGFSVRTEEKSSAIELLGGITELSGSSSSDTDILFSYLTSQELVRIVDEKVDLRAVWSPEKTKLDPIFTFDPEGTIEDLVDHWERKVQIIYNSSTGMIDLRILAFDPKDAQNIAIVLLEECSSMINNLSNMAREDAVRFARQDLTAAENRLRTARQNLTAFRNENQLVDPTIDTQSQMGLVTNLQAQLAETLIELDLLQDSTRQNDPRIQQAERKIEVIQERIDAERSKLGLGGAGGGATAFASIVGEYEGLIVDREFAEKSYTAALVSHDAALADASRQSRYLASHVRPTLAEKAEYPERMKLLVLIGAVLFFSWAVMTLIYYSLRDRS